MGEELLEVTPTPTPTLSEDLLQEILSAVESNTARLNDFYLLSTQNQEIIYNKMIQQTNYLYFIYGMLAVGCIGLVFYLVYRLFRSFF